MKAGACCEKKEIGTGSGDTTIIDQSRSAFNGMGGGGCGVCGGGGLPSMPGMPQAAPACCP